MKFLIIVPLLCAFGVIAVAGETRIVGGKATTPGEFPNIVSLQILNVTTGIWKHFCAGSIYDSTHIVTAAHCIWNQANNTANISIVAGAYDLTKNEPNQQRINVSQICANPKYTAAGGAGANDLGVLTLASALVFNTFVSSLPLNAAGHVASGNCVTPGWGNTKMVTSIAYTPSPTLLKLTTTIMPSLICAGAYPQALAQQENTICAKSTDIFNLAAGTCQGDSGGPFICSDSKTGKYLAGVVSWGFVACGTLPEVYADVGAMRNFLDAALAGTCPSTIVTQ